MSLRGRRAAKAIEIGMRRCRAASHPWTSVNVGLAMASSTEKDARGARAETRERLAGAKVLNKAGIPLAAGWQQHHREH
jgi:hypothetical protein